MYSQEKEQEIHLSYRRRENIPKKYAGNLNDYNHPNYIHDGRMYDKSRLKVKLQLYIYIDLSETPWCYIKFSFTKAPATIGYVIQ